MQIEYRRCLSNLQVKQRGSTNVEMFVFGVDDRALSLRAECAVAGIAQTGDDEAVFVKVVVDTDG